MIKDNNNKNNNDDSYDEKIIVIATTRIKKWSRVERSIDVGTYNMFPCPPIKIIYIFVRPQPILNDFITNIIFCILIT